MFGRQADHTDMKDELVIKEQRDDPEKFCDI
jgi:hypothetical protein